MLAHSLTATWRRMFDARGAALRPPADGRAAIHGYDPVDDSAARARCRDRARFHLGRARRAKDRGDYRAAAREIERALRYDDTSEAYFQVLGQCHLYGPQPDPAAALRALERALGLNPRNGYTVKALDNLSPQVHSPNPSRPDYLNPDVELIIGDVDCNL